MGYATAAMVIAAAVAATGTIISSDNSRRAANQNADAQAQAALAAQNKAAYDETMHREAGAKLLSAQRALFGKYGVSMEGSPLLVMEDTAGKIEMDALAIRYGGDIESARLRSAANLSKMQGSAAQTAGYFQAGSTLLAGASSVDGNNIRSNVTPTGFNPSSSYTWGQK